MSNVNASPISIPVLFLVSVPVPVVVCDYVPSSRVSVDCDDDHLFINWLTPVSVMKIKMSMTHMDKRIMTMTCSSIFVC